MVGDISPLGSRPESCVPRKASFLCSLSLFVVQPIGEHLPSAMAVFSGKIGVLVILPFFFFLASGFRKSAVKLHSAVEEESATGAGLSTREVGEDVEDEEAEDDEADGEREDVAVMGNVQHQVAEDNEAKEVDESDQLEDSPVLFIPRRRRAPGKRPR